MSTCSLQKISAVSAAVVAIILALTMCLVGCGGSTPNEDSAKEEAPKGVTSSEGITINGVYANSGYEDPKGSNSQLLYVFYSVKAPDSGLEMSSNALNAFLDGELDKAQTLDASAELMPTYYYNNTNKNVKHGKKAAFLSTFLVPPSKIAAGNTLTFSSGFGPFSEDMHQNITDVDAIEIPAENIVTCKNAKEIAKKADPKGYKKSQTAHDPASASTTKAVKNALNGFIYSESYGNIMMELKFIAPNKFELRTSVANNSGTYTVQKKYIHLKYKNGKTHDVPWSWKSKGSISLEIGDSLGL